MSSHCLLQALKNGSKYNRSQARQSSQQPAVHCDRRCSYSSRRSEVVSLPVRPWHLPAECAPVANWKIIHQHQALPSYHDRNQGYCHYSEDARTVATDAISQDSIKSYYFPRTRHLRRKKKSLNSRPQRSEFSECDAPQPLSYSQMSQMYSNVNCMVPVVAATSCQLASRSVDIKDVSTPTGSGSAEIYDYGCDSNNPDFSSNTINQSSSTTEPVIFNAQLALILGKTGFFCRNGYQISQTNEQLELADGTEPSATAVAQGCCGSPAINHNKDCPFRSPPHLPDARSSCSASPHIRVQSECTPDKATRQTKKLRQKRLQPEETWEASLEEPPGFSGQDSVEMDGVELQMVPPKQQEPAGSSEHLTQCSSCSNQNQLKPAEQQPDWSSRLGRLRTPEICKSSIECVCSNSSSSSRSCARTRTSRNNRMPKKRDKKCNVHKKVQERARNDSAASASPDGSTATSRSRPTQRAKFMSPSGARELLNRLKKM